MITLLYFARLREAFGTASEQIVLPDNIRNTGELLELLRSRGGVWSEELAPGRPVRMAANQIMVGADTAIADGDEVAIFPPVTGG